MDLRRIRYFVAVAEELHFRRAAERLHVTQPVVSEQIRKLEAELGVELLTRTQHSVALTEPGAVLLDEARTLLRQADRAARVVRGAQAAAAGRLRLGYAADALPPAVTDGLAAFGAHHADGPPLSLQPLLDRPGALLDGLRRGRLDAALVCLPAALGGLVATAVADEPAVVALPRSTRVAPGPISLKRLAGAPLTVLARELSPAFHDGPVAAFARAGLPHQLVESGAGSFEQLCWRSPPAAAARCCRRRSRGGWRLVP
jgi:DNA-binding transcriptional LysR family regulator